MEDVLDVYHRPYDTRYPQVCMDEGEPMELGKPARCDNKYERKGTISVFVACEPLGSKRMVKVCKRRTKKEWASFMREIIDGQYPNAEKIVLVMDNLNTHSPSSFYEMFSPQEARRLRKNWRSITRPNTEAGSTWQKSNSVCWLDNA